jgi:hypothetical protein
MWMLNTRERNSWLQWEMYSAMSFATHININEVRKVEKIHLENTDNRKFLWKWNITYMKETVEYFVSAVEERLVLLQIFCSWILIQAAIFESTEIEFGISRITLGKFSLFLSKSFNFVYSAQTICLNWNFSLHQYVVQVGSYLCWPVHRRLRGAWILPTNQ